MITIDSRELQHTLDHALHPGQAQSATQLFQPGQASHNRTDAGAIDKGHTAEIENNPGAVLADDLSNACSICWQFGPMRILPVIARTTTPGRICFLVNSMDFDPQFVNGDAFTPNLPCTSGQRIQFQSSPS